MKNLYFLLFLLLSLSSCKEKSPFLLSFEYERVLRSTNPKTGVLEARNQIPQDFPNHKDYVKYGEMEDFPKTLKKHTKSYQDSTIIIFDINRSGCMNFIGFTEVKNDTLYLKYKYEDIACTEEEIYRLKYVIENSKEYSFLEF